MNKYRVIGLMSGTSLDGLDIAYCEFTEVNGEWKYELVEAETVVYKDQFKKELSESVLLDGLNLSFLNKKLGKMMGNSVKQFCDKHSLKPDFVSSHGHTIFHQPQKGLTLQIGDGFELMVHSGLTVINDFRSLDIALGGQGAPLVPIGDQLLFHEFTYCLNLGGIANISFQKGDIRIAYDICPVNMVMNYLSQKLGKPYDEGGNIAQSGTIDHNLFTALNALPFYHQASPKSLGFEWVNENVMPLLEHSNLSQADQLCTFTHHVAHQIANEILTQKLSGKLLVTGGGAYNTFLIDLLKSYLKSEVMVQLPAHNIIQFKEALIFAFLGVLRLRNETNTLSSVTGASKDSSGGVIYST